MKANDYNRTPGFYTPPPPITVHQAREAALNLAQYAPDHDGLTTALTALGITDQIKEARS